MDQKQLTMDQKAVTAFSGVGSIVNTPKSRLARIFFGKALIFFQNWDFVSAMVHRGKLTADSQPAR
jgi:hypothetical protein